MRLGPESGAISSRYSAIETTSPATAPVSVSARIGTRGSSDIAESSRMPSTSASASSSASHAQPIPASRSSVPSPANSTPSGLSRIGQSSSTILSATGRPFSATATRPRIDHPEKWRSPTYKVSIRPPLVVAAGPWPTTPRPTRVVISVALAADHRFRLHLGGFVLPTLGRGGGVLRHDFSLPSVSWTVAGVHESCYFRTDFRSATIRVSVHCAVCAIPAASRVSGHPGLEWTFSGHR